MYMTKAIVKLHILTVSHLYEAGKFQALPESLEILYPCDSVISNDYEFEYEMTCGVI